MLEKMLSTFPKLQTNHKQQTSYYAQPTVAKYASTKHNIKFVLIRCIGLKLHEAQSKVRHNVYIALTKVHSQTICDIIDGLSGREKVQEFSYLLEIRGRNSTYYMAVV